MALHDLEAELRASGFDRAHLAVYADALLASGDPHGELITLDLELESERGADRTALEARRRELLAGILPEHPAIRCRHGFVDIAAGAPLEHLDRTLLGPLGPFVRELAITAPAEQLRAALTAVAHAPRPWLRRLVIQQQYWGSVQLPRDLAAALARAAPNLELLDVTGRHVLPLVPLPGLRQLAARPYHALAALVAPPAAECCLPRVETLALELRIGLEAVALESVLSVHQLPALRRLDLSRNRELPPAADLFRFVAQLALAPQLEELRVPSVLHAEQALNLQRALERMPRLARLEIGGEYRPRHIALRHPTATIALPAATSPA